MAEVKQMKSLKLGLVILGSVGLVFLSACSNSNQAANPSSSPAEPPSETAATTEPASEQTSEEQGGQVIESGKYHLKFAPEPGESGTHMDFYLQTGDKHQAISNANVTAQVQLPDGTQKTLPLNYDAGQKHYTAVLPEKATGQYQVKIISDINGEKVNGRFTINR